METLLTVFLGLVVFGYAGFRILKWLFTIGPLAYDFTKDLADAAEWIDPDWLPLTENESIVLDAYEPSWYMPTLHYLRTLDASDDLLDYMNDDKERMRVTSDFMKSLRARGRLEALAQIRPLAPVLDSNSCPRRPTG